MLDVVIRGGTIVDGSGEPGRPGDLGIRDGRVVDLALAPSEYAVRHFYFGIVRDPLALRMGDLVPTDRLMWGSDFPHSVSSYPESPRWLDEIFAGTPDDVRRRILRDNPCAYWGLDREAELTATPA